MSLPPTFLDEIRARLSLSEVVGQRLRLTRAGREHKACCPFHKEKTPSFTVNDDKGFFHCFGCGAHGDVIGFVMRHDHLSFMEAVEQLAGRAGLEVPRPDPQERARHERRKSLYELVEAACRYFEAELEGGAGRAARDYLERRGLDEATIARFRLGYAPAGGRALLAALKGQGFAEEQILEAGLARRPEDGREAYAFFRDRIMFPVTDARGRVVAFGARLLEGDPGAPGGAGGPKYLNSPDTPLFHKGQLLYGLAHARDAVLNGAQFVVVEGYLDVIALHQHGFASAVAPLGTAVTEAQIAQLWRATREEPGRPAAPVVCFDGDAAGDRAAARMVERVLPELMPNRTVRIGFVPAGQDPDSLMRTPGGADAFARLLDEALPLVDYLWRSATRTGFPGDPEGKAALRRHLTDQAERIRDRTISQLYVRELISRWYDALRSRPRGDGRQPPAPAPAHPSSPRKSLELGGILVAAVVHAPRLFQDYVEELEEVHIGDGAATAVYAWAANILRDEPEADAARLREAMLSFDPSLADTLAVVYARYRLHFGLADRDADYVRLVFLDILRNAQRAKLRYDYDRAVDRIGEGDEAAVARCHALAAEIDRLNPEQSDLFKLDALNRKHAPADTA
jgi:DNA primase